ncbi:MAG: radical SAM protein [Lachnospiraceae bacterium]|jgi:anaerobic magnesium-protoporphyrin IX monomethyl ester cyclase|nr:radical SAM protein [Lachnospiraceae bacterium]
MKICLINPSSNFNYDYEQMKIRSRYSSGSYNYVHLGLAYIASNLEKHGYETDILECEKFGITFDDIRNRILKNEYIAVGISTIYQNLKNVLTIAIMVKKINPNILVYLGGYGATFSYEHILRQARYIDFCMLGEGEITTLELVQTLEKGESWKGIKGIAYFDSGQLIVTDKRELIMDLDDLPFPKRIYSHEAGVAQIVASRGCYGKCTYCGIQEFLSYNSGACLRRRSPENVFEEMQELIRDKHISYFVFCDPNFVLNGVSGHKWVERFCGLLRQAHFDIHFDVDMRANEVVGNEDLLLMLKKVGLESVLIGIENFSQSELDFMNKRLSSKTNIEAIQVLQKLGFKYVPGLLLFNPVTTLDDILFNLYTIKSLDFSINNIAVKPITEYSAIISSPGLTIHKLIAEKGYYKNNERGYDFINKDVDLCYHMVQWLNQQMGPEILKYRSLADAAEELELHHQKKVLKEIYYSVYEKNLDIFIYLVERIKDHTFTTLNDGIEYMNTYIEWLSDIRFKLNSIYNEFEVLWSTM